MSKQQQINKLGVDIGPLPQKICKPTLQRFHGYFCGAISDKFEYYIQNWKHTLEYGIKSNNLPLPSNMWIYHIQYGIKNNNGHLKKPMFMQSCKYTFLQFQLAQPTQHNLFVNSPS